MMFFYQMYLVKTQEREVRACIDRGRLEIIKTILELFYYWFQRGDDIEEQFCDYQRQSIETVIYCCEILKAKKLERLFEQVSPESHYKYLPLKQNRSADENRCCLSFRVGQYKKAG